MSIRTMRILTVALPLGSIVVAGGIVGWEYERRDRLQADLARTEREIRQLEAAHPSLAHAAHDDD